jgi:hypothetical protein
MKILIIRLKLHSQIIKCNFQCLLMNTSIFFLLALVLIDEHQKISKSYYNENFYFPIIKICFFSTH